MYTIPPVSIVGLGKLGASMVAAIASRGGTVIGVDVNAAAVEAVNAGRAPVQETDLDATLAANHERIRATLDVAEAVRDSSITFVIVPTPSDETGGFSVAYAAQAFAAVGRALARKTAYHLVVLTSTVLPGATRHALLPILERESGRTAGADFGLCYSPEFIALGTVIRDFLNPDFTLVGELDSRSGDTLEAYYATVMANHPPCRRMSLENAELTKISINSYVTMKIAFANMLAALCERVPGGDVDVVTHAVGSDRRVGERYLKGGLGFGGPCFPRDNVALAAFAHAIGVQADLPRATDVSNGVVLQRIVDRAAAVTKTGGRIAVLGLAYKPSSHVLEAAQPLMLAQRLSAGGYDVVAFDPLVGTVTGGPRCVPSLDACLAGADTVVVATADPAFTADTIGAAIPPSPRPVAIVDVWRRVAALGDRPGIRYEAIGRHQPG
jgi:UDPglucose 6-dehydrogenase